MESDTSNAFSSLFRQSLAMKGISETPISFETACSLKQLVFGSATSPLPSGWINQSFGFSDKVKFGLVQHRGGPCGVLAAVQAHIIKENFAKFEEFSNWEKKDQYTALASGMASLLKICCQGNVNNKPYCMVLPAMKDQFAIQIGKFKADTVTEKLCQYVIPNDEDLEFFLKTHIMDYTNPGTSGLAAKSFFSASFKHQKFLEKGQHKISLSPNKNFFFQ